MALRLPKFENTSCCLLTACGRIGTEDKALLKWLAKQKPLHARYKASGRMGYARAYFGSRHFHIDVATKEYFGASPPGSKNKISEIRRAVKELEGEEVNVEIKGLYRLSKAELPAIIRSALVETQEGDVSLQTIGGTLAVRGAPIHELSWRIPPGEGNAIIILKSRTSTTINDSYLENCLARLEPVFKAFVLGK